MRSAIFAVVLAICSITCAAHPATREAAAASSSGSPASSRVVPDGVKPPTSLSVDDDLRTLRKSQTAAIEDLSNRLDQMNKRPIQLEKRDR